MKRKEIRNAFYNFVVEREELPKKLKHFLQYSGISKDDFKLKYDNLQEVEADVWKHSLKSALGTLKESAEFAKYSCREKGLAMIYTWFEYMDLNRKFFKKCHFTSECQLSGFKKVSKKFIKKIIKEGFGSSEFKDRSIPPKYFSSFFWSLFMVSLKKWRTKKSNKKNHQEWLDALVEKSMVFFFDSLAPNLFDAFFDFLKHSRKKK